MSTKRNRDPQKALKSARDWCLVGMVISACSFLGSNPQGILSGADVVSHGTCSGTSVAYVVNHDGAEPHATAVKVASTPDCAGKTATVTLHSKTNTITQVTARLTGDEQTVQLPAPVAGSLLEHATVDVED